MRIKKQSEVIFWTILMLLPIIIYFVTFWRASETTNFFTWLETFSPFTFISEIFDEVTETVFGTNFALNSYLAYCAGVEIFKVLYEIIIFIPRLANKWIRKAVQDE